METATQALHRLSSYTTGREWTEPIDDPLVIQGFEINDIGKLPWFYKRYEQSRPRMPLPRALPQTTAPAVTVLAGSAEVVPSELDVPQLSRLLHLSAGVVRTAERPYATWLFRAAGSAGGRFPLELYVAVPDGTALPAGVHWYHPYDHALIRIGPPPRGGAPAVVVTGVPWRTGWRYRERGYRHVYWDAGTMLAQLLASAASAGFDAKLYTRFPDSMVSALVGADGVHEWPVAVVALSDGEPALEPTGTAIGGDVDADPLEFPLVTAAQRAGDRNTLGTPWPTGDAIGVAVEDERPVEAIILARGSQRRMDPTRGLPENLLRTSMGAALRGVSIPHYVAVHDVDGIDAGLYGWPDLSRPIRRDALRDELYRVCWDQALGRDAAFVVIAATDVGTLDDSDYRDAQLGAGLVEGRLHLLAYALGASACGMTFLDAEVPALLGRPLDALLFTCVGVPEYPSAAGGPPGAPTAVRLVEPR